MSSNAAEIDTVLITDGSRGPYTLGRAFIDSASVHITSADTGNAMLPAYVFNSRFNSIVFLDSLPNKTRLAIHYSTRLSGLMHTYALYNRSYISMLDTSYRPTMLLSAQKDTTFSKENLSLTGFKSVGVSMNNIGNINLEQTLDVSLSGTIAPQTTISGHLTDQGSSLEGETREVSDLDMVYVAITNPKYHALIGDQYIQWPADGMYSGNKKIKGVSAGVTFPHVNATVYGAISAGKYSVQTITGTSGLQGPYTLTGNNESGTIIPIAGTVHVTIGNKTYQEGADADFTVNYETGSITFTANVLIRNDDIIRIEYEYRTYDYQRIFTGTTLSAATNDSAFSVTGTAWYETDDKNHTLDLSLTDADKVALAKAGDDSSGLHYSGRLIDPKDVAWESAIMPLYTIDALKHYHYTPYNPNTPEKTQGYYYVPFVSVTQGSGDYIVDSAAVDSTPGKGTIYRYAGAGLGNAQLTPLPMPQATLTAEITAKARLLPWLLLTGDYAAKNKDNNLFSSLDDENNFGSAFIGTALLGTKNLTKKSAWLSGTYSYISPIITDAVVSTFNLNKSWDDTTGTTNAGQRQSWESTAGASLGHNTCTEASYGQYINDSRVTTDRAGVKIQYTLKTPLTLAYDGTFFRHFLAKTTNTTMRDMGQALYSSDKIDATFTYNDEWRTIADSLNRGTLGAGAVITLRPASLTQEIAYHVFRKGNNSLFGAADTGHSILWNQTFKHTFSPAWTSSVSSNYNLESRYGKENSTTVLVTAANDVLLPSKGFSLQQKYQVTMEKAATYTQVPVYVGAGLGDYAWSDSLQQYMPAKNGDFVIQEQQLYGSSSDNRIRKTQLSASWSLNRTQKRLPGILGDIDWFGVLNVDENLRLDAPLPATSWLPGYTSLFKHNSLTDTMIPTAALSYRQTINWSPDTGLKGTFYVQPSLNKIRDYSERGTEYGGTIGKTVKQWVFETEGTLTGVQRQGVTLSTDNTYQVNDRKLELNEKRLLPRNFTLYIKETGGWAQKKSADADNSGWYSRCSPGILWQPTKKGQAELSYTYSTVSIPGTLDYRMAQGFAKGTTHVVNATMHMIFGTRFSGDIMYKGEFGNKSYAKGGLHVVSMQMKAFL